MYFEEIEPIYWRNMPQLTQIKNADWKSTVVSTDSLFKGVSPVYPSRLLELHNDGERRGSRLTGDRFSLRLEAKAPTHSEDLFFKRLL